MRYLILLHQLYELLLRPDDFDFHPEKEGLAVFLQLCQEFISNPVVNNIEVDDIPARRNFITHLWLIVQVERLRLLSVAPKPISCSENLFRSKKNLRFL